MWIRNTWNTFFNGKAAAWTAAATLILCAFTYLLFRVSEQADETAKNQARAFLSFNGFAIGPQIADAQGNWAAQEIEINWTNNGTTPAKSVVIQTNGKPFLEDLPDTYDFPLMSEKTQGAVGPKGVYGVSLTIPRSTLEDSWHGRSKVFIWGTALYKDVFPSDPDRLTEFCYEIFHLTVAYTAQPIVPKGQPAPLPSIGNPGTTISQFQWRACNRGAHSCYDEDCKDYADRVKDMRK